MNTPMIMIGAVTNSSAKIWCKGSAIFDRVKVNLFVNDLKAAEKEIILQLLPENAGIAALDDLIPNENYTVVADFFSNDGQVEKQSGSFRTFPAGEAGKFTFLVSSCNRTMGNDATDKEAWRTRYAFEGLNWVAKETGARFMIHTGDQIYIDTTKPKKAVNGVEAYYARYRYTWQFPELRRFFARIPNFMILDDHEIANEFDNELGGNHFYSMDNYKEWGLQAYNTYQHSHNPDVPGGQYYYTFNYGDVAFFVMDVRTERYKKKGMMISPRQMVAFENWLVENRDKVKMVVSPVPFLPKMGALLSPADKWNGKVFRGQRDWILNQMLNENTKNLFFLSGDIHSAAFCNAELVKGEKRSVVYELVSGPLNQDIVTGENVALDPESPVVNATFRSHWQAHTKLNVSAVNQSRLKGANVLAVTLDGNTISYAWYGVQEKDEPKPFGADSLEFGEYKAKGTWLQGNSANS